MSDFNPDVYWEMRGGPGYLTTLGPDYPVVLEIEKLFYRWLLHETGAAQLLDFGCGTGNLFDLWRRVPFVHAYDRSQSQIEAARKTCCHYDIRHGSSDDRTKTPYSDQMFDLIVACNVLQNVRHEDIGGLLTELHRICRGSVGLVVAAPFRETEEHSFDHDYYDLLKDGFNVKYDVIIGPYRLIWAVRKSDG